MSNIRIVEKMYDDFKRRNIDGFLEALDPDILWVEPDLQALPYPGVTKGRDAIARHVFPKIAEIYEALEFNPDRIADGGDTITVVGRATAKGFDRPEEHFPFAHILEFRSGKVVRFDHFPDTYKVARTLGFLQAASR